MSSTAAANAKGRRLQRRADLREHVSRTRSALAEWRERKFGGGWPVTALASFTGGLADGGVETSGVATAVGYVWVYGGVDL